MDTSDVMAKYPDLDRAPFLRDQSFSVQFDEDIARQVEEGWYTLVEVIKTGESSDRQEYEVGATTLDKDRILTRSDHHHHDGDRLVMRMGPDSTEDGRYSSVEIPNTRRFDQELLDHLMAIGAPNVMVPGRQAIWRDVVFSEHFADGRANRDPVSSGVCWQSWRGIEDEGLMPTTRRPKFVVVWFSFLGGPGLMPMVTSRSRKRRVFWAAVWDFNSGILWSQPVPSFDPCVPHDIAIRWLPDRSVSFQVDGKEVAHYEDGKRRFWAPGLMRRQFARGTDLRAHRFFTADPSHITAWITDFAMGNVPSVPTGLKFHHEYWMGLRGYGIEPLV
jgi:hypothetical protein